MSMRVILVGALSLMFAACSTVSRETGFASGSTDAFVIVAAEGMPITGTEDHSYTFRRIDLAASRFDRQHATVTFSGMGPMSGNEFTKPDGMSTQLRFGGKALPAGDYALISHTRRVTYGTATNTLVTCFAQGAAVYRFRPGVIGLVPFGPGAARGGAAAAQLREVLARYPNMSAQQEQAELLGVATFETGQWLGQQTCVAQGAPVFTPRPQEE